MRYIDAEKLIAEIEKLLAKAKNDEDKAFTKKDAAGHLAAVTKTAVCVKIKKLVATLQQEQPIGEEYAIEIGENTHTLRVGSHTDIDNLIRQEKQEQPHFADASKMERLNVDDLHEWSMRFAPDIRDAIEATAYHFWDLAIYSRKEQPEVDLEKEIEHTYYDGSVTDTSDMNHVDYENIARHFYELGLNAALTPR